MTTGFPHDKGGPAAVVAGPGGEEWCRLSRAGEALFVARPLDDFVAIAEAELGSKHALLVPQTLELLLEVLDLSRGFGVVAF